MGTQLPRTPPQGRADYAFFQHILKSMASPSPNRRGCRRRGGEVRGGRCAILFPHGVLFRKEEADMRQKLVDADLADCVLGLGANLFYNSPMEACIVICRNNKPANRRGRVIFIDAVNEVTRERSMSYLKPEHQQRVADAYHDFRDIEGFARVVTLEEIRANQGNLSIPLYVRTKTAIQEASVQYEVASVKGAIEDWQSSSNEVNEPIAKLLQTLNGR